MSKPSIQEQIKQKAKTVEETIHDEDQSLELCDMQCSHLCGCEGKCPFREHPHLVEVSDVLALLDKHVIIPYDITDREAFQTVLNVALKTPHPDFVVLEKEKLQELADLLKNRPRKYFSVETARIHDEWFENFKKKFAELTEQ